MSMKHLYWIIGLCLALIIVVLFMIPWNSNEVIESDEEITSELVATGLSVPWEIVFLEDELLVTERGGRLVRIGAERQIIEVSGVEQRGEGGLLGLALDPAFNENHLIYVYFTTVNHGVVENRVERYVLDLENNVLRERTVILSGIPGASVHDGGRIAFGPDGYLYITTGDATDEAASQDTNSLAGKILRIKADGSIPTDNPFNNAVYSYGHRNSQGIVWDDTGKLWSTEHGRSGVQSGFDELNNIQKGKNYGWPDIEGNDTRSEMERAIIHSGASTTWAPADVVFYKGKIFFTGLRGEALYEYDLADRTLTQHFKGKYGRLRALALKGDELYIGTSNRDGRGTPAQTDDTILKLHLAQL